MYAGFDANSDHEEDDLFLTSGREQVEDISDGEISSPKSNGDESEIQEEEEVDGIFSPLVDHDAWQLETHGEQSRNLTVSKDSETGREVEEHGTLDALQTVESVPESPQSDEGGTSDHSQIRDEMEPVMYSPISDGSTIQEESRTLENPINIDDSQSRANEDETGWIEATQVSEHIPSSQRVDESGIPLEQLYPPIESDADRDRYVDVFESDYPTFLDLYYQFRPKMVDVLTLREQLRSMPASALGDPNRRRELSGQLRQRYMELGFGNETRKADRVKYMRLSKKIRLLKERVKEYDEKRYDQTNGEYSY